jgi:hypothetical protein
VTLGSGRQSGMTLAELGALPPAVPAETAFKLLGCGRTSGYQQIRDGSFPVPVLRLGRVIRVPTLPLLKALGVDTEGGGDGPP